MAAVIGATDAERRFVNRDTGKTTRTIAGAAVTTVIGLTSIRRSHSTGLGILPPRPRRRLEELDERLVLPPCATDERVPFRMADRADVPIRALEASALADGLAGQRLVAAPHHVPHLPARVPRRLADCEVIDPSRMLQRRPFERG